MTKIFVARTVAAGAICLGLTAGVAKVVLADPGTPGGSVQAQLAPYNSQSSGLKLILPTSWSAVDTALGLQVASSTGATIPADGGSAPRLVLEIDRSDLLAAAIAKDGCCRLVVKDPKTGAVTTDQALPPAPAPTPTLLDAQSYASAAVAQAPAGAHSLGTRAMAGETAAVVSGLPNNGIPSVTVFVKHNSVLYTITAMGASQLSAEQDAVISSIQFSN